MQGQSANQTLFHMRIGNPCCYHSLMNARHSSCSLADVMGRLWNATFCWANKDGWWNEAISSVHVKWTTDPYQWLEHWKVGGCLITNKSTALKPNIMQHSIPGTNLLTQQQTVELLQHSQAASTQTQCAWVDVRLPNLHKHVSETFNILRDADISTTCNSFWWQAKKRTPEKLKRPWPRQAEQAKYLNTKTFEFKSPRVRAKVHGLLVRVESKTKISIFKQTKNVI